MNSFQKLLLFGVMTVVIVCGLRAAGQPMSQDQLNRFIRDYGSATDALKMVLSTGQYDKVQALLDAGADKNLLNEPNPNDNNKTQLMYACEGGQASGITALLLAGADPKLVDSNGNTALWYATKNGNAAAIQAISGPVVTNIRPTTGAPTVVPASVPVSTEAKQAKKAPKKKAAPAKPKNQKVTPAVHHKKIK